MKISYDSKGTITSLARDTESVSGENVATVADNLDVFCDPSKYLYNGSAFVRRPWLDVQVSSSSQSIGGSIGITIRAMNSAGEFDSSVNGVAIMEHTMGSFGTDSITISNGSGTAVLSCDVADRMFFRPALDGFYSSAMVVEFVK